LKNNSKHTTISAGQIAAHHFRDHYGMMVAALTRVYGLSKLDSVMDAVQDAFETAVSKWQFSGVPDNPSAWLMKVARNKLINMLKRESRLQYVDPMLTALDVPEPEATSAITLNDEEISDSQLHLLLACCNPAISQRNQIALTLHVLCGFGTPEIANALLMSHVAVKKAIGRSKSMLRNTRVVFGGQTKPQLWAQTEMVHSILYLMFNEGYKATRGSAGINKDLCYEAIRLTKILLSGSGDNLETNALLSLMFFHVSRFPARLSGTQEWLPLEQQNRSLWDRAFIAEGIYYLNKATGPNRPSKFYLEALIASIHCLSRDFSQTDWQKISSLYSHLQILEPDSCLVRLNRIIADSYLTDPKPLISELESIDTIIGEKHQFALLTTKAYLYEKAKTNDEAIKIYQQALIHAGSKQDKTFIRKKLNEFMSS
jgi:RNA polymerase sigma-70 factor (ECF subfamily)